MAHWYKPWLCDLVTRQGFVFAPDPLDGVLKKWSLDPNEVPVLYFWTKNPSSLVIPIMTWLAPYRVFVAVTITGWEDQEPRAPKLEEQLQGLVELVNLVGPDYVTVRYSPVPTDLFVNPDRYETWQRISRIVSDLGLTLDVSLLHEPSFEYEPSRLEVLKMLIDSSDIAPGFCGDDTVLLSQHGVSHRKTSCLDSEVLSSLFDLELSLKKERVCNCLISVDPCLGPKFACGSGCTYCYAPYTKK